MVKAAGKNANLLMNVGPQPNGELPATALQRLKEVGEWMKQYGETIYGTRGGLVAPHDWGVTTQKGNTLYVHILNYPDKELVLPLQGRKVKRAVVYKDKTLVRYLHSRDGIVLQMKDVPSGPDYIIELTLD